MSATGVSVGRAGGRSGSASSSKVAQLGVSSTGRKLERALSPLMASSVTCCWTRIDAWSTWLAMVTGSPASCRGSSRTRSAVVTARPAATRRGSGKGFIPLACRMSAILPNRTSGP